MNKQYYFLSGLPRSGSSLLCGILSANKSLHVSSTSGILSVLVNLRNYWTDVAEFNALDPALSAARKLAVMRGALESYYADVPQEIVVDKCRGWPQHLEMAEAMFGCKPRMIVTVRDVRDVLASFEKLWRKRKAENLPIDLEKGNPVDYQSIDGRCKVLMSGGGVVGSSCHLICDAAVRGWKSQMHFVEYEDLCSDPKTTMEKIYAFLEIDPVQHDFSHVVPSVIENDAPYGWGDLHTIRPVVQPQEPQWPAILPTHVAMQYSNDAKFWKNL